MNSSDLKIQIIPEANMFTITYDDKQAQIALRNLNVNLEMTAEPLSKSAQYMEQQARANFGAGGRVMSEGWPKLAPSTIKRKARQWGGTPMMVRTGLLRDAFMISGPRVSKKEGMVEVYNPLPYAGYHQTGTSKMPQRVLLKIMKAHAMEIRRIFDMWIDRIVNVSFK